MPASDYHEVRRLPLLDASPELNPLERFARALPYKVRCADRFSDGLAWALRPVALLHDEIAPDPPGWTTSLRFDVDCPCDGKPHVHHGHCGRAATYWRDTQLPEPSFVVVNPRNGHAHYVYLLRGWIRTDGAEAQELPAVRYLAAIARAYTLALHADPGYAGLVHHNPLSGRYTTIVGANAPYSLHELAEHVSLAPAPRRRAPEIRGDGRNIETFDRLRFWAYSVVGEWRCGSYRDWATVVAERALAIATTVRDGYTSTRHAFTDKEALGVAKSVAGWVWLRYDAANPIVAAARSALRRQRDRKRAEIARRAHGSIPRSEFLDLAQRRRDAALRLRDLGISVVEIAHRLSAGIRSVYRWLTEVRSLPRPSTLSDFKSEGRKNEKIESCFVLEKKELEREQRQLPAGTDTLRVPLWGVECPSQPTAQRAVGWRSPCDFVRTRIRKRGKP